MAKWADGMFADGWRDISSAPKDGTRFVVLIPEGWRRAPFRPCIAYWERSMETPRFVYDDWLRSPEATHWMPLPEPPK